jgi:hypothetical protein
MNYIFVRPLGRFSRDGSVRVDSLLKTRRSKQTEALRLFGWRWLEFVYVQRARAPTIAVLGRIVLPPATFASGHWRSSFFGHHRDIATVGHDFCRVGTFLKDVHLKKIEIS